jgi:hypothetical protein
MADIQRPLSPPGPPPPAVTGPLDAVLGIAAGLQVGQRNGVHGIALDRSAIGVKGENTDARGGYGVVGTTNSLFQPAGEGFAGVAGHNSGSGAGVKGTSDSGDGVLGIGGNGHAGVSAVNDSEGFGVWARGKTAGYFEGPVVVTGKASLGDVGITGQILGDVTLNGNLNITSSGDVILNDCAEHFDVVDRKTEPGTVMVIDRDECLRPSDHAYDKKVAGVVSGAGNFRPGIILGNQRRSQDKALLIALLGKVYCKVDAQYSPIDVGDLLTTSPTPGHAMKAANSDKAFGCVIGKALRPLLKGQGLIPILIALQ